LSRRYLLRLSFVGVVLGNHRNRLHIIADMLSAISGNAKKTQIMYRANLSYGLLIKYLEELSRSYLARFEQSQGYYVLTDKGVEFLNLYRDYMKRDKYAKKHIEDVNSRRKALEALCS
jgi:predicted transcriptional regulator